ncbi:uncharacterized protein H6S33_005925 [Morchella sextelata]|uniref:uncharacterized protein n=1 Tax=Morchella sextelata TaxID=1174677 RepID=UPI001D04396F|nr:uncharacterized protein H6S33_005925 [Morchella sextelata]KAH0614039.1 hypothetical protein H6S33_005925 [Morchella sextelata]
MAKCFYELPEPVAATVMEVDGIILTPTDALPPTHATSPTLITLPAHNPRPAQRASRLLAPSDDPPPPKGLWQTLYHTFNYLPALQRLYSTPTDLLVKHLLSGTSPHTDKLLGTPPPRRWNTSRSGLEKTEHIAFHPRLPLLALSSTWARIHIYDLRTGAFAPYFLCAADTPAAVTITSLAWNGVNQLAVGMDSGCVDVWNVDLSIENADEWVEESLLKRKARRPGPLFGLTPTPMRRRAQNLAAFRGQAFFETKPSPRTAEILSGIDIDGFSSSSWSPAPSEDGGGGGGSQRARVERIRLLPQHAHQPAFVGIITHVAFSPNGKHLALGTSMAGVWLHNITLETSFRAYPAIAIPSSAAHCTALAWSANAASIVAAFAGGLVVVLPVRENGAGSVTVGAAVRFYPHVLLGVRLGRGVGSVLIVPGAAFPTVVVALKRRPGVHVFRLVPESVLRATVRAARAGLGGHGGEIVGLTRRIYNFAIQAAAQLLFGDNGGETITIVHVGSLETEWTPYAPTTNATSSNARKPATLDDNDPEAAISGYGGAVQHMALDPSGQRLIVVFSGGPDTHRSVVWFDASSITASAAAIGALGVLKMERVGEVGFAAGGGESVCAGIVVNGGRNIAFFRGVGSENA